MSEWPYIIAAYSAAWTVLLGFATYLEIRRRRVARSLPFAGGGK